MNLFGSKVKEYSFRILATPVRTPFIMPQSAESGPVFRGRPIGTSCEQWIQTARIKMKESQLINIAKKNSFCKKI